jgi:hypothetical protein
MTTPENAAVESVEPVDVDPYTTSVRNTTIDEIADALARFRGAFGEDTIDSFAIYIRGLKR